MITCINNSISHDDISHSFVIYLECLKHTSMLPKKYEVRKMYEYSKHSSNPNTLI